MSAPMPERERPIVTLLHPAPAQRLAYLRESLASEHIAPALRARREARVRQLEQELAEAPPALEVIAPALEQWRRRVMERGASALPLERAAAWELTALELERFGASEDARVARRFALEVICRP